MEEKIFNEIRNFMEQRELKLAERIIQIEKKLSTIKFEEDGKLSDDFELDSPYYSPAEESADIFRFYIIGTEIREILPEIKILEDSKKAQRDILPNFYEQRKLVQTNLRQKEKEINEINISFLTISDEKMSEAKEELERKRVEKRDLEEKVDYYNKNIETIKKGINELMTDIKLKKDIVRILREEQASLKVKRTKKSEYLNLEEIRRDIVVLNTVKLELYNVRKSIDEFYDKMKGPTKSVEIKEESKLSEPIKPIETKEEIKLSEPIKPIETKEEIKLSEPIKTEQKRDWKMDGFKMDFIEKFGYVPSYSEVELNKNYKGDYSSLISHPREMTEPVISNLRERVVTGIRNISSSVVDNIKKMTNKVFKNRDQILETSIEGSSRAR